MAAGFPYVLYLAVWEKDVCVGGGDAGPGRTGPMLKVDWEGGGEAGPGMRPWELGLYVKV